MLPGHPLCAQFVELQAFSSSCPSLSNLAFGNITLTNITAGGCGPVGPRGSSMATTSTGSRCLQSCSGASQRQRGGMPGVVECRAGEWDNTTTGLATGGLVCGSVCPPLSVSLASPLQCVHTVVSFNFTGNSTGTILDWFPTWKIYKGGAYSMPISKAASASRPSLNLHSAVLQSPVHR